MITLEKHVIMWANNKGLLVQDNSSKQVCKMVEEVGEVAKEVLQGTQDGLALEIGDVMVTSIILAAQNGLSATKCLELAFNKIEHRKGETINGTFVKCNE